MNRIILHWSYRDFREFPSDLIEYEDSLEELYLKENFIPTMPKWLFQFIHLRFIQMSGNIIESINDAISELENLEYLDFSKNRLTDLPETIIQLNKLQYLNVNDNKISSLNKGSFMLNTLQCSMIRLWTVLGFGRMKMLTTLNFSKNCLAEIPLELAESKTLTELYLNDNLLREIPAKIVSMPSLRVLEAESTIIFFFLNLNFLEQLNHYSALISGCLLKYLPGIISNHLKHIRFFNNTRLTHYPRIYEKFLCLHYDYWSESVVRYETNAERHMQKLMLNKTHTHTCRRKCRRSYWCKAIHWTLTMDFITALKDFYCEELHDDRLHPIKMH